jgi:LmbE family N-acetylglucosaminyl deacetylase
VIGLSAQDRWSVVLPRVRSVLAVCAHPDDESFGLGGALASFTELGAAATVLCFTRGEASSLGAAAGALARIRADELRAAAQVLKVGRVALFEYPDGGLAEQPLEALAGHVQDMVGEVRSDLLLVLDTAGITGHPDHQRATEAARVAADAAKLPVLAWVLPEEVALRLRAEFGVPFVGRRPDEVDFLVAVDRGQQRQAIACHQSQSLDNPVLWRRLELQGSLDAFRWLHPGSDAAGAGAR